MEEPQWMQGAFNDYWDDFVVGRISYKDFCEAIQHLPYVPDECKENHKKSLELYQENGDDFQEYFPSARIE